MVFIIYPMIYGAFKFIAFEFNQPIIPVLCRYTTAASQLHWISLLNCQYPINDLKALQLKILCDINLRYERYKFYFNCSHDIPAICCFTATKLTWLCSI